MRTRVHSLEARIESPLSTLVDFVKLTKPRIMMLLLISTCCPMVLAAGGQLQVATVLFALLGGALVSGSASALNCIWDQDIDAIMVRTQKRPLPSGRISQNAALIFSITIGVLGLWVLARYINTTASLLALGGHLFYVIIYTMWLKRSTPQNIVIGGAAGAVPPLVGWAAVTGEINLTAILLFLVVFLWTPPHFWALALNRSGEYEKAGVPMMPVTSGELTTHRQMLWYALALIPVTVLLVYSDAHLGLFSLVSLTLLGVIFSFKVVQLMSLVDVKRKEKKAWDVFGFSLIYLSLFFVCLVVDSTIF